MVHSIIVCAFDLLLIAASIGFLCLSSFFKMLAKPPTKAAKACAKASEFFDEKSRGVAAQEFDRRPK